jgi:hypothetical protein
MFPRLVPETARPSGQTRQASLLVSVHQYTYPVKSVFHARLSICSKYLSFLNVQPFPSVRQWYYGLC